MSILRNMKIGAKLTVGFGLLLVVVLAVAAYGVLSLRSIEESMDLYNDYPVARYNNLNDVRGGINELRRIVATMSFRLGYTTMLNTLNSDAQAEYSRLLGLLEQNLHSLRTDPSIAQDRRVELIASTEYLQLILSSYRISVVAEMFDVAMGGVVGDEASRQRAVAAFDLGVGYTNYMLNVLYGVLDGTRTTMTNRRAEMSDTSSSTITFMMVLTFVGVGLGVLFAVLITRVISKPITEVAKVVNSVSGGNFNINFRSDVARDEVGVMTQDVYNLVSVVRTMVDDISTLGTELSVKGDIEYRVDASKYQGGYKDMVDSLNGAVSGLVDDTVNLLGMLGDVNKGVFVSNMKQLPGKKQLMNQSADDLIASLTSVSSEVNAMIDAAANKGDMSFRIDAKKYEGDWGKIMDGLNDIAKAVYMPLKAIEIGMKELEIGDTNLDTINSKIVAGGYDPDPAAYNGIFRDTIHAFDQTALVISSYISEIDQYLAMIAEGDLTKSITREYVGDFAAIKNSINNISKTLNNTMSEITSAADQVLAGATQISTSASDMAVGAQEQASSVEELNASIIMVNEQTDKNAQNAGEANTLSGRSAESAREGSDAMEQMLAAMHSINESSNSITKIIKTIEDIAFQTNLLALNASVEAARAGEHGRGFAVVAEEVRTLASRSSAAAAETTGMIGESIQRVEAGSTIAASTSESLAAIVESVNDVLEIINNIAISSKEQAEAVSHISDGLAQISKVVQSNSATSEETAAASQELSSQAQLLQQLVSFFKV
ncbi:MAG: methyl-accepting chemotaxis protein [Defluviitaleaceae bacterium]|nr:methyl-accepting chemotaxis protein [Defluviitaleaceae bacterium]